MFDKGFKTISLDVAQTSIWLSLVGVLACVDQLDVVFKESQRISGSTGRMCFEVADFDVCAGFCLSFYGWSR